MNKAGKLKKNKGGRPKLNVKEKIEKTHFDFVKIKKMAECGFNEKELAGLDFNEEEPENNYSRKIESPVYEPKNEKPEVSDLVNLEKYNFI